MTLESAAALAEIISSVAIVVTLLYLAVQAKQTKDMLLGNSRQAAMSADVTLLSNVLSHSDTASGILGIDSDRLKKQVLLIMFMRAREFQWLQFRAGTLDRATFESYMSPVKFWLTSEVGTAWWASSKRTFDRDFVAFIDNLTDGHAP